MNDLAVSPVAGPPALRPAHGPTHPRAEIRQAFDDFVGQTFFSQLLAEMRKSVAKPAYLHGGATEEVFQGQLDQVLSEKLSAATAEQFSGPMFELFMLPR
jgi:Rod binding domain-containing protein